MYMLWKKITIWASFWNNHLFYPQAQAQASNLEKKQKKVDQQINEWKLKCDEIQAELEKAQKDARSFSSEVRKHHYVFQKAISSEVRKH